MVGWLVDSSYSRVPAPYRRLHCGLYAWGPPGPDDRIYGGRYGVYMIYIYIYIYICSLLHACVLVLDLNAGKVLMFVVCDVYAIYVC